MNIALYYKCFCNVLFLLLHVDVERNAVINHCSGFEPVVVICALSDGLFRQINCPPTSLLLANPSLF